MIRYIGSIAGVTPHQLHPFFVGWPNPPSPETHLRLLKNSAYVWLAIDEETGQVVGFVNAISDYTLAAYIPLVEVLPAYQFKGIGVELMHRMLATLKDYYMVDLLCERRHQPGYETLGMTPMTAMMVRNFEKQSGNTEK